MVLNQTWHHVTGSRGLIALNKSRRKAISHGNPIARKIEQLGEKRAAFLTVLQHCYVIGSWYGVVKLFLLTFALFFVFLAFFTPDCVFKRFLLIEVFSSVTSDADSTCSVNLSGCSHGCSFYRCSSLYLLWIKNLSDWYSYRIYLCLAISRNKTLISYQTLSEKKQKVGKGNKQKVNINECLMSKLSNWTKPSRNSIEKLHHKAGKRGARK